MIANLTACAARSAAGTHRVITPAESLSFFTRET